MGTRVIADSTSYMGKQLLEKYNINQVSLSVDFGDESYRETEISNEDFYNLMDKKGIPKSSQPPIGELVKAFYDILKELCVKYDFSYPEDKLIELFSFEENLDEIILTEFGQYRGVLNKSAIIKIISEKRIVEARNQNPLTKLAGNIMISDYIQTTLDSIDESYAYVYFDFNNFKSFNDKYGFKKGDEAILLFSEILRDNRIKSSDFIGHVGGDDFFLGIRYLKNDNFEDIYNRMIKIAEEFKESAKYYYSEEDIEKGFIKAPDRRGIVRRTPLLTTAIVFLEVPLGRVKYQIEEISELIFKLKKTAKNRKDSTVAVTLMMT